ICPAGHYCPEGSQAPLPCPRGRFGFALGMKDKSCSGLCAEGYWCPEASWRPDAVPCGNASYFCRAGSSFPQNVLPSFYSVPEEEKFKSEQKVCEPGYYCLDGVRHACPAGVFGDTKGLMDPNCTARCPVGYYCPERSEVPIPCPAGRFGLVEGLSDPLCSGACDKGHWCPLASSSPQERECPGGRFGPVEGLRTSHCSETCEPSANVLPHPACVYNFCKEGYYCPSGSSSATQQECGGAAMFCPVGSEEPTPVYPGHYTIGQHSRQGSMQDRTDARVRTWQTPCEPGFYCSGGVKERCPAGRFGQHPAEVDPDCSGPCDAGYYCNEGSAFRTQNPCGSVAVYCPEGSFSPTVVPAGYYSVNGTVSTRPDIAPCPPGHYCTGGIKRACAAGRYSSNGSPSEECDGLCAAGYYCPTQSTSPTERSCPAGRYGHRGMTDEHCIGTCSRGYFCPSNSTSPHQYECGGEYLFCPIGSAYPVQVDLGHY
ncbi:unnamed protein product, partial [Ectocarpus fasciculatus]